MSHELPHFLARVQFPQAERPVHARGEDMLAIGGKDRLLRPAPVANQFPDQLSGLDLEEA